MNIMNKRASMWCVLLIAPLLLASCTAVREDARVLEEPRAAERPHAPRPVPEERRTDPAPAEPAEKIDSPAPAAPAVRRRTGRVAADTLNVRAGPNINYEILGRMNRGETVVIVGSEFEWHEIELPSSYKGWIHSDFVRLAAIFAPGRRITGTVTGSRVNVRARPGTGFSVIAQVQQNDRVVVVDEEGGWLGIEIARLATGWVHSQHIDTAR